MSGKKSPPRKKKKITVDAVDLFCGSGGLTHGLERAGINVTLGVDIDPACEHPFTKNNRAKFLLDSIEKIEAEDINSIFDDSPIRLLAGCAPCQTFSTYNQKAKKSDKRWWLLRHFSRLVDEVEPELVTMENVPNLFRQKVFQDFVSKLRKKDYEVSCQLVNCSDYGVPQTRKRLVLLASKFGPIELLSGAVLGEKSMTVRQAIGGLPSLQAGEVNHEDPCHSCSTLSDLNMRRIKASRPGGTWRDWSDDLVAECHKKASGRSYPSVYGRMSWDEPAPTITTQFYGFGNGRFGHPEQNRALSFREGAILQSFPHYYSFTPPGYPISTKPIGRLIGNAVPVKLGEAIGKSIVEHVKSHMKVNGAEN